MCISIQDQATRNALTSNRPIDPAEIDPIPSTVHSLTRTELIKQDDWNELESAEKDQLDLYETQQMFSPATKLPNEHGINVLAMVWIYLVKTTGRKKARCVANGNPQQKGSVTLANTYTACFEQACRGSRSGTTANKINPYYLIGSIFFYIYFFILIFQWLITGGTLAYKGSPIANN